jgi:hypothetical protein
MTARHKIRICTNNWESSGLKRVWKIQTLKFFSAYTMPYDDAYSFPFPLPFFGYIAKTRPQPSFFNRQAFQHSKQFFLNILVHINSHSKQLLVNPPRLVGWPVG